MSFFDRLPLTQKIAILGLTFLLGFAAFAWRARVMVAEVGIGGPAYARISSAKDVVADVLPPPEYIIESHLLVHQALAAKDQAALADLIQRSKRLRREFDERHDHWAQELGPGPLKDALITRVHAPAHEYYEVRDRELFPALLAGDRDKAKALLETRLEPLYETHRHEVDEVVKLANAAALETERSALLALDRSTYIQIALAAAVVLVLLVAARIGQRAMADVVARIGAVTKVARRVAAGDLSPVVMDASAVDTRELVEAISTMTESLRSLVSRVKQTSILLTSTATTLGATSRDQDAMVHTLSSSTAETAASTKQISATSQSLQKTMETVAELAERAVEVAEAGRGGLGQMRTSVDTLEKATVSVSGRLSSIRERATDITGIVTTMTKVAEQTNLLSVNAAIEAEKAGEQGRGFLVVAREIRRLADQSAIASLDIEHMVRQMQGAVTSGVMEMDRFSENVRRVAETTTGVSSQLSEVIDRIGALGERIDQVGEGMQSQSLGAKQISEAMQSLKEGTVQSVSSVAELLRAASGLEEAVGSLRNEISHFAAT